MAPNIDMFKSTIECTKMLREGVASGSKSTKKKSSSKSKMTESRAVRSKVGSGKSIKSSRKLVEAEDILTPVDDQVIAVVDPEMTAEDMDEVTSDLQSIVDDAEDGEVPEVNDYVGNYVYQCSVCGNNFFSEDEIDENPIVCPVCGEEASVVAQGEVEEYDTSDDEDEAEFTDDDEDSSDEVYTDDMIEDEYSDEEDPIVVDDEVDDEVATEACARKKEACARKKCKTESVGRFDDRRMSSLLSNYLKSNYRDCAGVRVTRARINPTSSKLTVEGVLRLKSGATKSISFTSTTPVSLRASGTVSIPMVESSKYITKKMESTKRAPFVLGAKIENRTISPVSFKYNYIVTEGSKRYSVSGSPRIIG